MIALASECLLFKTASGDSIPFSAEMVSAELAGAGQFDADFVKNAAAAVFHFFKHELGRHTVSVAEFTEALEKVLRGFRPEATAASSVAAMAGESAGSLDLNRLARESGIGCELVFFPRLRDELRRRLQQETRVVRFHGLRGCVKHMVGATRWGQRCRQLEEQIVAYLRECANAESTGLQLALLVEA